MTSTDAQPQPEIEHAVLQLAMYTQRRDQLVYGRTGDVDEDGKVHVTPWEEVDPMGVQQYLEDARVAVNVMLALGWSHHG